MASGPLETKSDDLISKYEGDVLGIVEVNGKIILLQDNLKHLKEWFLQVYECDGSYVTSIPLPGDLRIPGQGLVNMGMGDDYAANFTMVEKRDKAIHFLSMRPDWKVLSHKKKELEFIPYGLAYDQASQELIACDRTGKAVKILSKDGQVLRTFQIDEKNFRPYFAVKLADVYAVVSRRDVFLINPDGTVKSSYEWKGTINHASIDPKKKNLLILEGSKGFLHELDEEGNLVQTITCGKPIVNEETNSAYLAINVHLSEGGRLYVGYQEKIFGQPAGTGMGYQRQYMKGKVQIFQYC